MTTGAVNVILGDDARLSDARTPTAHNHDAATITTGTMAVARLGTGSPTASNFLRGDGTWATPAGGGGLLGIIRAYLVNSYTNGTSGAPIVFDSLAETPRAAALVSGNVRLDAGTWVCTVNATLSLGAANYRKLLVANLAGTNIYASSSAGTSVPAGYQTQTLTFVVVLLAQTTLKVSPEFGGYGWTVFGDSNNSTYFHAVRIA